MRIRDASLRGQAADGQEQAVDGQEQAQGDADSAMQADGSLRVAPRRKHFRFAHESQDSPESKSTRHDTDGGTSKGRR